MQKDVSYIYIYKVEKDFYFHQVLPVNRIVKLLCYFITIFMYVGIYIWRIIISRIIAHEFHYTLFYV